ncbi:hypothetical protein AOT82_1513 [Psychrobacter sp. AntiMn-1]|nr:hypothetical protein AOT82_1513 [Psychrobacter sp. AntiMn-1]
MWSAFFMYRHSPIFTVYIANLSCDFYFANSALLLSTALF